MKRLIISLKTGKYKYLTEILFLIAFGQGAILILGGEMVFSKNILLQNILTRISGLVFFFLFGCAGFVGMIREEFRQAIPIRGKYAQILGFLMWILFWGIALNFLIIWFLKQ